MRRFYILMCFLIAALIAGGITIVSGEIIDGSSAIPKSYKLEVDIMFAPPAQSPPYDDDSFFSLANETIHKLCNGKELAVGKSNIMTYDSLEDRYYKMVRMKVSQERHADAENIMTFISYTLSVMDFYNTYEKDWEKDSPVIDGMAAYNWATAYYNGAVKIWDTISTQYPDAVMYKMPPKKV
ncbi:hypothetical protein KHC33_12610 [Methanospirillum sp. J.3.6.1-F.2.7.3]|uniref:Uncharacterized protein n=1 Tax=Methanospirillum purgamenti TaxID=2834276 RepID=A0A8E7EIJ7_9EURY|nr:MULTISPECIES: hypothetical protein [Methanospirillum]MDX8550475.1 hypothetical protein [Methanospirillum hungatei]QVV88169.1 hypothetical protein KHC33_12610 [Methanospirillum sp. J.3.6.1-F.2.7.3]